MGSLSCGNVFDLNTPLLLKKENFVQWPITASNKTDPILMLPAPCLTASTAFLEKKHDPDFTKHIYFYCGNKKKKKNQHLFHPTIKHFFLLLHLAFPSVWLQISAQSKGADSELGACFLVCTLSPMPASKTRENFRFSNKMTSNNWILSESCQNSFSNLKQ